MAQSGLLYKFEQTNLDLESPLPEGGPINVPRFNHTQKYAPNLTYLLVLGEVMVLVYLIYQIHP